MLQFLGKSQLFIAFCALMMCAESFFLAGLNPDYIILATIFFATLFIYNAAQLKIAVKENLNSKKMAVTLSGEKPHAALCVISLVLVFTGLAASHYYNILIFVAAAVLSIFYMMPFTKNGHPVKGLRNHLFMKNIVLSVIWASATVLFPLAGNENISIDNSLAFMFIRRFFFIYALTVVYDIRDIERDRLEGLKTLAVRFGDSGARLIALLLLSIFVVFVACDPVLNNAENLPAAIALYVSALFTAVVIACTTTARKFNYYSYVIDGSMAFQFVLVVLFTAEWF